MREFEGRNERIREMVMELREARRTVKKWCGETVETKKEREVREAEEREKEVLNRWGDLWGIRKWEETLREKDRMRKGRAGSGVGEEKGEEGGVKEPEDTKLQGKNSEAVTGESEREESERAEKEGGKEREREKERKNGKKLKNDELEGKTIENKGEAADALDKPALEESGSGFGKEHKETYPEHKNPEDIHPEGDGQDPKVISENSDKLPENGNEGKGGHEGENEVEKAIKRGKQVGDDADGDIPEYDVKTVDTDGGNK